MNIADIKNEFPIFANHPDLVYLDSAASAQKPQSVIDAEVEFYAQHNANVHRGIYDLSEEATDLYELARDTVANFINAEREEVVFTSGTTDSINGVARSLELSNMLNPQPKVVLTELEHHANILPWQRLDNAELVYLPVMHGNTRVTDFVHNKEYEVNKDFTLNTEDYNLVLNQPFDVLAVTHISNVTGTMTDIQSLIKTAKFQNENKNMVSIVDAAQSVAHTQVDVNTWAADFVAFSGHKLYGPTGVGVLFGKKELFEKMEPFRVGGGMITEVRRDGATWAEIPTKFEAGTPPVAQAIGLGAAIKFIQQFSWQDIQDHEQKLRRYAFEQLQPIPGISIFHPSIDETHGAVISFAIENLHAHDISQILAEQDIAVRAGHHCTHVLHREVLQVPATVRISFGIYNDEADIDKLIAGLKLAIQTLK